ncbi:hypothetical protein S7335_709 [Synechococcus sp. PCC 7335]|nr:hypothetical protein S7335_709 [Synechococcus sp. PCC 7335]
MFKVPARCNRHCFLERRSPYGSSVFLHVRSHSLTRLTTSEK